MIILRASRILSLFCLLLAATPSRSQPIDYPPARQIDQVDEYHGIRVPDPYQWMEDLESTELHDWMRAQDQLLENYLSQVPLRQSLSQRIYELRDFEIHGSPTKTQAGYFYGIIENGGTGNTRIYFEEPGRERRLLIDPAKQFPDGLNLTGTMPSPDGGYVAYFLTEGQSRWRELRILDVATGRDLPETLRGLHGLGGSISWKPDGSGFAYVRHDLPDDNAAMPDRPDRPRVAFHTVGSTQTDDYVILDRDDSNLLLTPTISEDGRYLVITERDGASQDVAVLYRDLHQDDESLTELIQGPHTFLGNDDDRFYFYSTLDAPNGRIISLDLDRPDEITELVSERAEPVSGNSLVGGNGVGYYGGRFVLLYTKDALPLVRVFDNDGQMEYEVDLPDVGTIWGGFTGRSDDTELFYRFLSLTDATVVYRLDLATGETSVFGRPTLAFDSDDFMTKQVFVESKDGTRVPMFVVHRKDLALDGSHPLFMYAYGVYAWTAFLWYQPHIVAWLEMGGVYALPGIRGGGEYGREWHQGGVGRNRQNAIDDYLAAAAWLIENGYSSPDKLVANGGSASGSLAGAAVIQRPDLFGAAVIDIPTLDMVRRGGWKEEFGDPENPDDFEALLAYSPYQNVDPATCYPPMLVIAGEEDETAMPFHAYKFIAKLQADQDCGNPALLKVMWGAGHSHGATPVEQARTWADAWSYLNRALDLGLKPAWRSDAGAGSTAETVD